MTRSFASAWGDRYPPVLSIEKVADMLGVGVGTIRDWLRKGRLEGSYRKRGKRLYFWRDKVLDLVFNDTEWK